MYLKHSPNSQECGAVLVLTMALAVVFIVFTALIVSTAVLVSSQRELNLAAVSASDAAALAFIGGCMPRDGNGNFDPQASIDPDSNDNKNRPWSDWAGECRRIIDDTGSNGPVEGHQRMISLLTEIVAPATANALRAMNKNRFQLTASSWGTDFELKVRTSSKITDKTNPPTAFIAFGRINLLNTNPSTYTHLNSNTFNIILRNIDQADPNDPETTTHETIIDTFIVGVRASGNTGGAGEGLVNFFPNFVGGERLGTMAIGVTKIVNNSERINNPSCARCAELARFIHPADWTTAPLLGIF